MGQQSANLHVKAGGTRLQSSMDPAAAVDIEGGFVDCLERTIVDFRKLVGVTRWDVG